MHMFVYVCVYVCMYVCMYVDSDLDEDGQPADTLRRMQVWECARVRMHVCTCVCVCVYVCMYVCMYACVYVCVQKEDASILYTYIHTYR